MRAFLVLVAGFMAGCDPERYPCDIPLFEQSAAITVHETLACPAGGPSAFTVAASSGTLRVSLANSSRLWLVAKDRQGKVLEIRGDHVLPMPEGRAEQALAFTHHRYLDPQKTEAQFTLAGSDTVVLRYKTVSCTCEADDE